MCTDVGKFFRRIDEFGRGVRQFKGAAVHGVYSAPRASKRNEFGYQNCRQRAVDGGVATGLSRGCGGEIASFKYVSEPFWCDFAPFWTRHKASADGLCDAFW